MQTRARTPFKAMILRDVSRADPCVKNPLHPDPYDPIIDTRDGVLPMGLGGNAKPRSTTILPSVNGMVGAKVGDIPQRYQRVTPFHYHTTTKTPPLHVCARARLHAHGSVYIYGSMVVDRYKALIRKGKSPYFCPLPCPYHAAKMVVRPAKSLKSFEKGDFCAW